MTVTDHGDTQEELVLHFARFCWRRANTRAPSGATWAEVFVKKTGRTLTEYKEYRDENFKR